MTIFTKNKTRFSSQDFLKEIEDGLPQSTENKRRKWAATIVEKDLAIKDLSKLLSCHKKVASRFLWLLSDVGIGNPKKLFLELPFLFSLCERLDPEYLLSFASYWNITGVPVENEARAIDLLFRWFLDPEINVTTKSRALWVLVKLSEKYPDLKQELKLCIEDQMHKSTKEFEKRAAKILLKLDA